MQTHEGEDFILPVCGPSIRMRRLDFFPPYILLGERIHAMAPDDVGCLALWFKMGRREEGGEGV